MPTVGGTTPTIGLYRTREWPAWQVPAQAAVEWARLSEALVQLEDSPACADHPEAWWSKQPSDVEAAQVVCAFCPVVEACRAYVVAAGAAEREGVWGGLAPDDRISIGAAMDRTGG